LSRGRADRKHAELLYRAHLEDIATERTCLYGRMYKARVMAKRLVSVLSLCHNYIPTAKIKARIGTCAKIGHLHVTFVKTILLLFPADSFG
jgi:hypothetical protein